VSVDAVLDVFRAFWRAEAGCQDAAGAEDEAARMLQRFGRTWVMRIKTKRTQIEKLEHIFYTHDLQIHDGKEFGAFSFQEFKGLLRKAGFPGLGDKFQCKLFDEWNDKADWMEAQQALGKKPAGKAARGTAAALKGAGAWGAPPGGRGGGSSTGGAGAGRAEARWWWQRPGDQGLQALARYPIVRPVRLPVAGFWEQ
ncbi:unnamed protein product, partial [Heterosigma akashiwo]